MHFHFPESGSIGTSEELAENQKPQSAGSNPRAGWKFLVELLRWSNGYLCEG
jgi:hypothetical protein